VWNKFGLGGHLKKADFFLNASAGHWKRWGGPHEARGSPTPGLIKLRLYRLFWHSIRLCDLLEYVLSVQVYFWYLSEFSETMPALAETPESGVQVFAAPCYEVTLTSHVRWINVIIYGFFKAQGNASLKKSPCFENLEIRHYVIL